MQTKISEELCNELSRAFLSMQESMIDVQRMIQKKWNEQLVYFRQKLLISDVSIICYKAISNTTPFPFTRFKYRKNMLKEIQNWRKLNAVILYIEAEISAQND